MTDRAQPGAIDSIIRNDELAQALDSFTQGGIVSGTNPTDASIRRSDIDETALDAFSLSSSASSLDVTVAPGEAFVAGWLCRDTSTTLTLPANTTTDIVIGHATDAIFDPTVDPDRDAADEVIVDLAGNIPADIPQVVAHRVETDGAGVTSASRVATVGGFSQVDTGNIETTDLTVNGTATGIDTFTNGEDYDGLGTGDFSNLSSLNVSGPASVGDLTVNGTSDGINTLIDVPTEADLPPIDPPQIAFIRDKNEYQKSIATVGFDLNNVTRTTTIRSAPKKPQDIFLSNDGTKLFTVGDFDNPSIFERELNTAFDLSSASSSFNATSIASQDSNPAGLTFNDDGSRMYVSGGSSKLIFESSLSTPFDITTATFQQDTGFPPGEPSSLEFNNDGTLLFIVDNPNENIVQTSLSTPFDISTLSVQQSINFQGGFVGDITFNNDGTELFEVEGLDNIIFKSSLSTPFDLSTASFQESVTIQGSITQGLFFNKDGTKLFGADAGNKEFFESTSGVLKQFKPL
jgi:hypothetical protein